MTSPRPPRGRPRGAVLTGAPAYVRASPEERAAWDAAAAALGWSTSQWLREAARRMLARGSRQVAPRRADDRYPRTVD